MAEGREQVSLCTKVQSDVCYYLVCYFRVFEPILSDLFGASVYDVNSI